MERKYHVAIDIGAGSSRLFMGYLQDNQLHLEEIHRFETGDMIYQGQRVRNVYRWYEEMIVGLKKFTLKFGNRLESIACDCMGEDMVLLDQFGGILMPPPSYRSVVLEQEVLRIEEERMGNYEIFKRCGNQSVKNDTLRQLIGLSLQFPQMLQNAGGMLFLGDLFHYLFCGTRAVGYSLASYGKLFNQHTQTWDEEIFSAFHLPDTLKMPIAYFGDQLGRVHAELCADIGLSNQPLVISPGIHDSSCAAFCIPDKEPDWAFISSGSWSIVGMQIDHTVINEESWRFNCSNSGMPMNSNMFKKLVAGMWIIQRCQKEWQKYSFAEIVNLAKSTTGNHFYIDPDDEQFYNPENMCQTICQDIFSRYGVHIKPNDTACIACICFESLALKYRFTLDKLQKISGRHLNKICIVGGGSRNEMLNQLSANACQMPVYTGVYEASITGNLLVQMVGCGELADEYATRKILRNTFHFNCNLPQETELWQQKYADYVKILEGTTKEVCS